MFSQQLKHKIKFTQALLASVAAITFSAPGAFAKDIAYHVENTQHLSGAVKWDFLTYDPEGHHLFITHGDSVNVYDVQKNKVIKTIKNTHGVHGVALAPDISHGFASNGNDNTVTVFNLTTLKTIATVPTEKKPDAIVYDDFTKRVFTANATSHSLSVIDAKTNKNIGAVALSGKPESATVDGKGLLYVNIEDRNQVAVVDTKNLKVTATYDISSVCSEPTGLAMDTQEKHLFVSCSSHMSVVDASNGGKVLATFPIGAGSDSVVYDDVSNLAFSSNADGTLTIIGKNGTDYYQILQIVKTMPGARTMALNPVNHKVYLVSAEMMPVDKNKPTEKPVKKDNTFTLITVAP